MSNLLCLCLVMVACILYLKTQYLPQSADAEGQWRQNEGLLDLPIKLMTKRYKEPFIG